MKKFIIAAALIFTTGIIASQVKANTTPKPVEKAITPVSFSNNSKELASAD